LQYYDNKQTFQTNPTERVEQTLKAIGWPTMQGGLATALAMWPLLLKRSYLAVVFLKTVVLVISLGLVHSMIVLPALLTSLDWFNCNRRAKQTEDSSSQSNESNNPSARNSLDNILFDPNVKNKKSLPSS
jgi:predicted RND superfamily exporter protein